MAAASLLHVQPAVVVLDLDGTTLDADHKLAPATLAALRRASKAVRLIFATGRPTWDAGPAPWSPRLGSRGSGSGAHGLGAHGLGPTEPGLTD